jgi:hypothetical protein
MEYGVDRGVNQSDAVLLSLVASLASELRRCDSLSYFFHGHPKIFSRTAAALVGAIYKDVVREWWPCCRQLRLLIELETG